MADIAIRGGNRRPVMQARARQDGWTRARRQRFLDTLAATCNVQMACAAAGLCDTGAYKLRQRDPAFAELWQEALEIGYDRLEQAVLEHALKGVNAITIAPGAAIEITGSSDDIAMARPRLAPAGSGAGRGPAIDVPLALLLLNRHRGTIEGQGPRGGKRTRATTEETDAALIKKLETLLKQRGPNVPVARLGTARLGARKDGEAGA